MGGDRAVDVFRFIVDSVPFEGQTFVRVRCPDIDDFDVVEATREEAIAVATSLVEFLRRFSGNTDPFRTEIYDAV